MHYEGLDAAHPIESRALLQPVRSVVGKIRQRVLEGFKSKVASVGPEVGYVFKIGKQTGYFNLRGYWEFWAQNRLEGYALFATVNLPFGQ